MFDRLQLTSILLHPVRVLKCLQSNQHNDDANTILGNKISIKGNVHDRVDADGWPIDDTYNETVLRTSSQCLPIIRYDKAMVNGFEGLIHLKWLTDQLKEVVDETLNDGHEKKVEMSPLLNQSPVQNRSQYNMQQQPTPPGGFFTGGFATAPQQATKAGSSFGVFTAAQPVTGLFSHAASSATGTILMPSNPASATRLSSQAAPPAAPSPFTFPSNNVSIKLSPPKVAFATNAFGSSTAHVGSKLDSGIGPNALKEPNETCDLSEECAICIDVLSGTRCLQITSCRHIFHDRCIEQALGQSNLCPVCRKNVGEPQGLSPSGSMKISSSPKPCKGFESNDTIVIVYNIPASRQKSYHINPGEQQHGKNVTAYLPNNLEGRDLLKRLKYAFMHGLTFIVGTSMTSNKPNQCTWSSIHHKTKIYGGIKSHGFPDPNYFINCNKELDGLNVPSANDLGKIY